MSPSEFFGLVAAVLFKFFFFFLSCVEVKDCGSGFCILSGIEIWRNILRLIILSRGIYVFWSGVVCADVMENQRTIFYIGLLLPNYMVLGLFGVY